METARDRYIKEIIAKKIYRDKITGQVVISTLTDGGSSRVFCRVAAGDLGSIIYMWYTSEKEENGFYSDIDKLLTKIGVNVPAILYRDNNNIFIEDLGDRALFDVVTADSGNNTGLYVKVLDQLLTLHRRGDTAYREAPFAISRPFEYSLYRWESEYFLDNLITGYYSIRLSGRKIKALEADLDYLARVLSAENRVLIHRDCQSKNIMVRNGVPYFIDFQGMRYGLAQYDLASLLEDPYVSIDGRNKRELLAYYADQAGAGQAGDEFLQIYRLCAVQRLMQALGAYAFLGMKKKKEWFRQFIPRGLQRLKTILEQADDLGAVKGLLPN